MSEATFRLSLSLGITVSNARNGEQAAITSPPQISKARLARVSFVIIPSATIGYFDLRQLLLAGCVVRYDSGDHIRQEARMIVRSGSAHYSGLGKDGKGQVSTQSGVLDKQPYGFGTRFENEKGTNPEELIAAAHAACFTMALSFALARAGYSDGQLDTTAKVALDKEGEGFRVTTSALSLRARVPGIDKEEFAKIADDAKANCPISKLLNAEITLERVLL
jgi:osmotically inducible protein OsmC